MSGVAPRVPPLGPQLTYINGGRRASAIAVRNPNLGHCSLEGVQGSKWLVRAIFRANSEQIPSEFRANSGHILSFWGETDHARDFTDLPVAMAQVRSNLSKQGSEKDTSNVCTLALPHGGSCSCPWSTLDYQCRNKREWEDFALPLHMGLTCIEFPNFVLVRAVTQTGGSCN